MNENIQIPWVEKYRPKKIEDIILPDYLFKKFNKFKNNLTIPNLIITGEPSTGKTSTVFFLAQNIYKEEYNEYVLELNASDDRGLNTINNIIIPFCKKKKDKNKLIILDEADSITPKGQNLLSNIIINNKSDTRFVFTCNDYSKIIENIQSICLLINFPRISKDHILKKLIYICKEENITYTQKDLKNLIFLSENDIRNCINNLESISNFSNKKLSNNNILKIISKPRTEYIKNLLVNCQNKNLKNSINIIKKLYDEGNNPNDILLVFMNFILENEMNFDENLKLNLYEIISNNYVRINDGIDSLIQLFACVSKVFNVFNKNQEDC